ncbi:hypothetical protein FACS1894142_6650 [Spirochaetia bacterium]|nr:hypothetical protein FACS1894142_6650 [Spirochaetia bacterium]
MYLDSIKRYFETKDINTPLFAFVGDGHYSSMRNELSGFNATFINISEYCSDNDKVPNFDLLVDRLKTSDVNAKEMRIAVFGIGEYLGLLGRNEVAIGLSRLKDVNTGKARVVLILRGVDFYIEQLRAELHFDNRKLYTDDDRKCDLSFVVSPSEIGLVAINGFKSLLKILENGTCGNIDVNTIINLSNEIFPVRKISDAYEGIQYTLGLFDVPQSCGNKEQWQQLLKEIRQNNKSMESVYDSNGLSTINVNEIAKHLNEYDYRDWLGFIRFKYHRENLNNCYLNFVLEKTIRFDELGANILNTIIDIPHTDKRFNIFYAERKSLLDKFSESDIASFVVNNRINQTESIYKLTDTTITERGEIIKWVAKNGYVQLIDKLYPDLAAYLKKYIFKNTILDDTLTDYFANYKKQKISNSLDVAFIKNIEELAQKREYNQLPTRNAILDNIQKDSSFLCWIDALGVEYLAFFEYLTRRMGLSISIKIARAELPTITSFNKAFFYEWPEKDRIKIESLDEIKHKEAGGYNYENEKMPIHLAKELDVIVDVMERAATKLKSRDYKSFVIASDHGASRLAVLSNKEEKYDTDTKGEHSGRCCKLPTSFVIQNAAEENGFLVLADYGRFKGSRAANVEVHGGASLEEVVVPVIELKLKNDNIIVRLEKEEVIVDYKTGMNINLFFNAPVLNISVIISGKKYIAKETDKQHYLVRLSDIKRAGEYSADVYTGDDLIGSVLVKAQGKSGKIDTKFDDLF